MKILYINAVCGVGSTGRIVTDLMQQARQKGHIVKVACSTNEPIKGIDQDEAIVVGSRMDYYIHNILSRITDHEGLYSKHATNDLIKQIKEFDPDVVHIHNLHGHWINYEILFQYLAKYNKKVILTLHDCWMFTGHCSHFSKIKCEQWKSHCIDCPGLYIYPKCYGKGDVSNNYDRKKKAFTSVANLNIVTPSQWLADLVKQSFLGKFSIEVVHNKIDLSVFKPVDSDFRKRYNLGNNIIVLGVSNVWNKDKGFDDFMALRRILDDKYAIVMVGVTKEQLIILPENIIGIQRTQNASELAEIYSAADVFVNLTYQDNFPTVNLEAISCGTPVISYITGGSCEAFDDNSGISVKQGDLKGIVEAINNISSIDRNSVLNRSQEFENYGDYWPIYNR